jgi:hypothetical protein
MIIIQYIIHNLIIFCSRKAREYDETKIMLSKQGGNLDYIYAIGLMVHSRDKWLKKVKQFQKLALEGKEE